MKLMEENPSRRELVTVDELMRWLRLGRTRTNELLRSGEIPSLKLGRRRLILVEDVVEWLEQNRYQAGA